MTETRGYTQNKDAIRKRLNRVEGQVRGVSGMVEDDRYCIDVVTQITAIQAALDKVALELLSDHTKHCVLDAGERRPGGEDDRDDGGGSAPAPSRLTASSSRRPRWTRDRRSRRRRR